MNVKYQLNLNNITNTNYNYIHSQPKYASPLYLSPKKKNENYYYYNYGMRHYYSAGIKYKPKINHNYQKPIYILNPHFVETQLIPNKSYNDNSVYTLSNPVQYDNNKPINNSDNKNNINTNNGYQIRTQKTIINNIYNINSINPQININQNKINNQDNININNYNLYNIATIKNNQIQNNTNKRMTYGQYTNPYKSDFEFNISNPNDNIFNINKNNIQSEITQKSEKSNDLNENQYLNNTMPHLTRNEDINLFNDERITYPVNSQQIQPLNLLIDNNKYEDKVISSQNIFQNSEGEKKVNIINNNNNINIINNINNWNNINLNIIENNINEKYMNNNENNYINNEHINSDNNKIQEMNELKNINYMNNVNNTSETLPQINIYNNLYNTETNENYINNEEIKQILNEIYGNELKETEKAKENIPEKENQFINFLNNNNNNVNNISYKTENNINNNNIINKDKEKIINQIQNVIIEEKTPIINIKLEGKKNEKDNKLMEIDKPEKPLNLKNNISKYVKEQFDKNKIQIIRQEKIEIKPEISKITKSISKNNYLNNSKNLINNNNDNKNNDNNNNNIIKNNNGNNINNNDKNNDNNNIHNNNKISNDNNNNIHNNNKINNNNNNKKSNDIAKIIKDIDKNEKQANKSNIKIKKYKRPVYKIPPSKKRSISEGNSLAFIHKYYDENFILEEDSEYNSNNEDEIRKSNKNIISKNIPQQKVFKEVKVRKVIKK